MQQELAAAGAGLQFAAGQLNVLKLRRTSAQVHVTIVYPRIKAGGGLVPQVTSHHASRITLTVHATDAFNLSTKLTARVNRNP